MSFHYFSMPKNRKMTKKWKFEKNQVEKNKQNRKSWKKRTRGNCEAEAFQCQQKTIKKLQEPKFRGPFWKYSGHNCPFNP